MKTICVVLFGTLLCGFVASRDSGDYSDSDKSDVDVDVSTDEHETTVYCNRHCNCEALNGTPKTYCCPDGKADPSQCPGSILSYGGNPGRYDIRPIEPEVVQYMPRVISPGNTLSYEEYLDWIRRTNRADYAVTNNCKSRLSAVLGACRSAYAAPCIQRNCKPALPIYNQCTARNCNPVPPSYTGCTVNNCPPVTTPYTGCATRYCNTASRCCRPQVATNHLRDAILSVVTRSYSMTKGEFIGHIEAVLARQRELDWDPVMIRGSTGVNWPNNWPVYKHVDPVYQHVDPVYNHVDPVYNHAGVVPSVDTTDDADDDVTLEDSTENEFRSL